MGIAFLIDWKARAIAEQASILANAEDPDRIRKATEQIDYLLRRIPNDIGESRGGGYRLWYNDVLGVFFHVDNVKNIVEIMRVALSKRPK